MNANELLNMAIKELDNLKKDEEFLVKDLFRGYEWKRIKISDRLTLGVLFLNYVKSDINEITPLKKTASNQQIYKKV